MRHWMIALTLGLAGALSCAPAQAQAGAACPAAAELDAAATLVRAGDAAALSSFRARPECHRWVTFYFAAEQMFAAGERDEAVRWFYVGQLRGRTVAVLDPGATQSVVDALQHVIGQPLNEHAGGDRSGMIAAIDWAASWDLQHPLRREDLRGLNHSIDWGGAPLPFEAIEPTPTPARFERAYAEQRAGMAALRQAIADIPEEDWRRIRRENGLE